MRLRDKVAIVTGAGSGFGAAIARLFAEEGASVVVADINDNAGRTLADTLTGEGRQARFVHSDVTQRAEVAAMVAAAREGFGRLDLLVNNAGYTHTNRSLLEVDEEEFDRIFAVNVKAIYLATLRLCP